MAPCLMRYSPGPKSQGSSEVSGPKTVPPKHAIALNISAGSTLERYFPTLSTKSQGSSDLSPVRTLHQQQHGPLLPQKNANAKNSATNSTPSASSLVRHSSTLNLRPQSLSELTPVMTFHQTQNDQAPPPDTKVRRIHLDSPQYSKALTKPDPVISEDRIDNRDQDTSSIDFTSEEKRLKSFDKWPHTFLTPSVLARNGFYYLGRGDEVRCAYCRVEIMKWVPGDDPAADHKRWAPQCPFVKKNQVSTGNVPIEPTQFCGRDECGAREAPSSSSLRPPVHPTYSSFPARLNSFADWPKGLRQDPEQLADAGFFYTGSGDKTKCFYCDGGLKDWEDDDVPWEEHAKWFDRCPYVMIVKGKEYIQKINSEVKHLNAPKEEETKATPVPAVTIPATENKEKTVPESQLCIICCDREREMVFIPCGHVVTCSRCSLSTKFCPMCRRSINNVVKLYFS